MSGAARMSTAPATGRRLPGGLAALATALSLALAACGGGGGGVAVATGGTSAAAGTTGSSASYSAVAMAGELVSYTVDTANLTYRYTIMESMYGLQGSSGSGMLVANGDGTYSPSGMPNAKIAILPNGLLLAAIRETLNGTVTTVPVIGVTDPVTTLAAGAGTYNFVQRSCISTRCVSAYGTFRINPDGTWASCPAGNLTTGCPGPTSSGTLNALGGGKWQLQHQGLNVGTALMFSSAGQNVMMLDLTDTRPAGFGVGMLVGATQQAMSAARTNGTWFAASSSGDWGAFTVSGTTMGPKMMNGMRAGGTGAFAPDTPWTGMSRGASGGYGVLAGNGVYVYQAADGNCEVGIRLNDQ